MHRALLLKEHIDSFFDTFGIPDTLDKIEEDDWQLLLVRSFSSGVEAPFYLSTSGL